MLIGLWRGVLCCRYAEKPHGIENVNPFRVFYFKRDKSFWVEGSGGLGVEVGVGVYLLGLVVAEYCRSTQKASLNLLEVPSAVQRLSVLLKHICSLSWRFNSSARVKV